MTPDELRDRLLTFAIRVIKLCVALPNSPEGSMIRRQLVRAGTSPGAQYREACRSRSRAEFVSKVESAQQELDETQYWLLIVERSGMIRSAKLTGLRQESDELMRILAASARTAKARK
jgi:four helix bundle protein